MITYVQGDLLEAFEKGEIDVILHQTNCVTKDNVSGIAKSIFSKYPEALVAHLDRCKFGSSSVAHINRLQWIINCNSQYYPGACNNNTFIYKGYQIVDNFYNRLQALKKELRWRMSKKVKLGIPLIASGLGADLTKKGAMSDLEYFQKFIAPEIENIFENLTVYYL